MKKQRILNRIGNCDLISVMNLPSLVNQRSLDIDRYWKYSTLWIGNMDNKRRTQIKNRWMLHPVIKKSTKQKMAEPPNKQIFVPGFTQTVWKNLRASTKVCRTLCQITIATYQSTFILDITSRKRHKSQPKLTYSKTLQQDTELDCPQEIMVLMRNKEAWNNFIQASCYKSMDDPPTGVGWWCLTCILFD